MTNTAGPHFVISGYRNGTSPDGQGTLVYYWSSSAYLSATNAYTLGLSDTGSTVYPASSNFKRYGFSLRCLAQKSSTCLSKRRQQL